VHDQNETQILAVFYLIIGVIIKEQNDTYINYMMELDDQDCEKMQELCQDSLGLMENFEEAISDPVPKNMFNDSPDFHCSNSITGHQDSDKIDELNLTIEALSNEKRTIRIEISEEK
jgi:hypothetical protein